MRSSESSDWSSDVCSSDLEQDVLGADVVVVEHPGFFLSQDHDSARPVGKSLEHLVAPSQSSRGRH
jgi:hypothetical protein